MSPRLSDVERSVILWSVFAISSALAYLLFFWECTTLPYICPGTSYHVTQFYQAFPRVSTASDKRWGENSRGRGRHCHVALHSQESDQLPQWDLLPRYAMGMSGDLKILDLIVL